jgi:hypothetical protein
LIQSPPSPERQLQTRHDKWDVREPPGRSFIRQRRIQGVIAGLGALRILFDGTQELDSSVLRISE